MEKKLYHVANDKCEISGHDMNFLTAQDCLVETKKDYPGEGWKILKQE